VSDHTNPYPMVDDARYDDNLECTWCGGDGVWEGGRFGDPGWYDEREFYPCPSCNGTGNRKDMTLW